MKIPALLLAAAALAAISPSSADAKGCLKGAAVGGVAGHYAGHHGVLGAAAGCLYGRHHAKEQARPAAAGPAPRRPGKDVTATAGARDLVMVGHDARAVIAMAAVRSPADGYWVAAFAGDDGGVWLPVVQVGPGCVGKPRPAPATSGREPASARPRPAQ